MRRKTIYEYHRIAFHEDEVTNGTVIILTALPTCLEKKNCTSCMKKDINFEVICITYYNLNLTFYKVNLIH